MPITRCIVPAILLSGVFAALVALVTGVLIMRLSRVALSIATFAFLAIVIAIYSNWHRVTAGTSSIIGIPVLLSPWSATPWVLFTLLGTYLFEMSRLGLSLRASRDDEIAARAARVRP